MCNFKWLCCRIQGGFGFARCGRNEMAAGGMKGRADGTNIWEVWCNKDAGRLWGNIWKRPIRAWKSDSTPPTPSSSTVLRESAWLCGRSRLRAPNVADSPSTPLCLHGRPSVCASQLKPRRAELESVLFLFFFSRECPDQNNSRKLLRFWKRDNNYWTLLFTFQCVRTLKAAARGNLLLLAYN